jgi:high-affinity nickel permease
MTSAIAIATLGFFLGMRHATDADHVIAVTTIVARHRNVKSAAWIGAVWGIGHTVTILVVGGAIILFSWVIPPRIGLSMELAVGLMLVVLGVMNVGGFWRRVQQVQPAPEAPPHGHAPAPPAQAHGHAAAPPAQAQSRPHADPTGHAHELAHVHSHAHRHGDYIHTHSHEHDPERHPHDPDRTPLSRLDQRLGSLRLYQLVRPLVVGVVHGLAGSAAIALLVLTTIRSTTWGVVYLLIFGLGTIAGMMLVTAVVSVPFAMTGARFGRLNRQLRIASGVVSLAFGLFIAWRIGIVGGLFTGHPRWTPR